MKICYVITKSAWGGAGRYVYDLATNLPKADFEVMVVCGGAGPLVEKLNGAGVRVITLPHLVRDLKIWGDFLTLIKLFRIFRRERPDIVHLNSAKIGGLGALAAKIYNLLSPRTYHLATIYTVHGWTSNEDRPGLQKKLIRFLESFTLKMCHQVITVSEHDARAKTITIHNGIRMPDFLYRDTAREQLIAREPRLKPYRRELWLGTIAELHRNKDLINAIGAVALLRRRYPEVRYLIIGEGEQREILTGLIKELGLGETVFLLGHLPEAARYLKAFDIFLLNSRKEGLPYAVLEAGLAGLPVVATRVGGIPEIITDDQTGLLVSAAEPEATAEALATLAANGLEREILGRNLETVVRTKFSLEQMVDKTTEVYNKVDEN